MKTDMEQKWLKIKKNLDRMTDEEFSKMIRKSGHYNLKFAEDSLYVKAMIEVEKARLTKS